MLCRQRQTRINRHPDPALFHPHNITDDLLIQIGEHTLQRPNVSCQSNALHNCHLSNSLYDNPVFRTAHSVHLRVVLASLSDRLLHTYAGIAFLRWLLLLLFVRGAVS